MTKTAAAAAAAAATTQQQQQQQQQQQHQVVDPRISLPRDETGSYHHLKLKRFPSIKELTMPFAKKSWSQHPEDASVDIAHNARSKCRQCHTTIPKSKSLRFRLWLQCHKGCKNSAYFHPMCFWEYPETSKLKDVSEIIGLDNLNQEQQNQVKESFEQFQNKHNDPPNNSKKRKLNK